MAGSCRRCRQSDRACKRWSRRCRSSPLSQPGRRIRSPLAPRSLPRTHHPRYHSLPRRYLPCALPRRCHRPLPRLRRPHPLDPDRPRHPPSVLPRLHRSQPVCRLPCPNTPPTRIWYREPTRRGLIDGGSAPYFKGRGARQIAGFLMSRTTKRGRGGLFGSYPQRTRGYPSKATSWRQDSI